MHEILEKLFAAANNHGVDTSNPAITTQDLRALLLTCWDMMSIVQRRQLLCSDAACTVIAAGARGEFNAAVLITDMENRLSEMTQVIAAAGYTITALHEDGCCQTASAFYWETDLEAGEDFPSRGDAVVDAYADWMSRQVEQNA